jgi:lipopolysaccharide biosynthesis glycosyltransferase
MDECVVVFCFDVHYVMHAYQAFWGLLQNFGSRSKMTKLTICVVFDGVQCEEVDELTSFTKELGRGRDYSVAVHTEYVDMKKRVAELDVVTAWPPTVYARFQLGSLFPLMDRILYLDLDITVVDDVGLLFKHDLRGYPIGAIVDYCDDEKYFNSGVLLMDLVQFRGTYESELFAMQRQMPVVKYPDQDVLNKVFSGKWLALEQKWNYRSYWTFGFPQGAHCEREQCLFLGWNALPSIIHYACPEKPWKKDHVDCDAAYDEYQRCNAEACTHRNVQLSTTTGTPSSDSLLDMMLLYACEHAQLVWKDKHRSRTHLLQCVKDRSLVSQVHSATSKTRSARTRWFATHASKRGPFPVYSHLDDAHTTILFVLSPFISSFSNHGYGDADVCLDRLRDLISTACFDKVWETL